MSIISEPFPEMNDATAHKCEVLRNKAEDAEYEDEDAIKAFGLYHQAAEKGDVESFREMFRIDRGQLVGELVSGLQAQSEMKLVDEQDLEFVQDKLCCDLSELPEDELKQLLHVSLHYDILRDAFETVESSMIEARDAGDPRWMGVED